MSETTIPALIAANIHKRFGALEVLKGVSVTAHEGDVISMIGNSGSGKSTFLRQNALFSLLGPKSTNIPLVLARIERGGAKKWKRVEK